MTSPGSSTQDVEAAVALMQFWSTNLIARGHKESDCQACVVGKSAVHCAVLMIVGAMFAAQRGDLQTSDRCCLTMKVSSHVHGLEQR